MSLAAEHIRNEKVKVLRSMKKLSLTDVVIGQYRGRSGGGVEKPGYLDDDTVPEGRSVSPLACCRRAGNILIYGRYDVNLRLIAYKTISGPL